MNIHFRCEHTLEDVNTPKVGKLVPHSGINVASNPAVGALAYVGAFTLYL